MGGRGGSSGLSKSPEKVAASLEDMGGKRWTKNGKDRVYLRNVIGYDLDTDAPGSPPYVSRSVRNIIHDVVDSAYYDVKTGEFEYKHSRYEWANNHVEREWKKAKARMRKR